jgi:hypothetical protein
MPLLLALLSFACDSVEQPVGMSAELRDSAVIRAVLRDKIYGEAGIRKRPPLESPALIVFDRSFRFCDAQLKVWCMPEELRDALDRWLGTEGSALAADFVRRNHAALAMMNPDPPTTALGLSRAFESPVDDWWPRFKKSHPGAWGYARFSAPGYNGAGEAVVYVTFSCGVMCGQGWLIRLAPVDGDYHVVAAILFSES